MNNIDSIDTCKLLYSNPILSESEGILLRSRLQASARRLGFSDAQRQNMVLVASEMASNQSKYANGHGMMQIWQQPGPALDLVALDFGPGIGNITLARQDGYSTAHTLGKGLGSIQRLSDESGVYSLLEDQTGHWHGSLFWARFNLHDHANDHSPRKNNSGKPKSVEMGLYSRALLDDRYNGDRIYVQQQDQKLRWLHLDGLGHGEGAQSATVNLARHLFQGEKPTQVLATVDRQLAGSRGAVAILGEIDLTEKAIEIIGVGDMAAHVMVNDTMQAFSFAPGILGKEHKTPRANQVSFDKKCIIVSASDGIRRGWKSESFPGLFNQHPQIIAYLLGNIMGRVADDQSVCTIRIN